MSNQLSFSESLYKILSNKKSLFFLTDDSHDNDYIKFYIEEAKPYKPTAIYVTQFQNQPPKPQIYIYDNTDNHLSGDDILKLHKELWSSAKVPLFFIFSSTEVKIFNSRKSPDTLKKLSILETINLASYTKKEIEKRKLFSSEMFDSGSFWENKNFHKEFEFKHSVYNVLLDDLENLRQTLIKKSNLNKKTIESILIKSIFVKYLDERGVFRQESSNFWSQFDNNTKFSELFDDSSLIIKLFEELAHRFNGGIFDITDIKNELQNADLSIFKDFLNADIELTNNKNKQKLLWAKYSFKDLPIELISNIYELFLKSDEVEKNGIVYTPPLLVDFMIDEIMPLSKPQNSFKLIDPSCGSGIFLVGAYKRLVQWWRIKNNFEKPTIKQAQDIIKNSIFGVDKEKGAIEVAYFSLSLALCDTFLPQEIWQQLKFEDLRENNLLAKDFFKYIEDESNHKSFDLVIGNPPFVSQKKKWTTKAQEIAKDQPVPDAQLAFLFLRQSLNLLKKDAFLVMIQPSAFLYNHGAYKFRNEIFENYKCHQIVDFACLNTTLFKKSRGSKNSSDVAVSVPFLQNEKPKKASDTMLHITVRQTLLAKEKIYFDLSHYDFHWLGYKDTLKQKSIWKCNLMGGSRIRDIINRLEQLETLKEYLKEKEKNGWEYSEGFIVWKNGKKTANHITGKKVLPAQALSEEGIDKSQIYIYEENKFERIRTKKLFEPPLLLIKEKLGNKQLIVALYNDYITFKNDTIGIHAPEDEKFELENIYQRMKKHNLVYFFYIISTTSSAGVGRATSILKKDIDSLPYPKKETDLKLSKTERYFIDDTLDYMMDFCKGKKDSPLLKNATDKQMNDYIQVYKDTIGSIYDNIDILGSYNTDLYQIVGFYFGDKPRKSLFDDTSNLADSKLTDLIHDKYGKTLYIAKILRIYDNNIIYIIKPRHYRFWLKSIAVRDADETFTDLLNMGY
jgi:tRNA1(Val) A37 N6-methylase TrmN6